MLWEEQATYGGCAWVPFTSCTSTGGPELVYMNPNPPVGYIDTSVLGLLNSQGKVLNTLKPQTFFFQFNDPIV